MKTILNALRLTVVVGLMVIILNVVGRDPALNAPVLQPTNTPQIKPTSISAPRRASLPIQRISVASDGSIANRQSGNTSISSDGRYVAFESSATNLVWGSIEWNNIFVHDRHTGETTIVSINSEGAHASCPSAYPSISADGRYVAFQSLAENLDPNDTNIKTDIFVHDRHTGETTRVSIASDGAESNGQSYRPSISPDGRYVVFSSDASNLVPNDTNAAFDIFMHDRHTGETSRIMAMPDGKLRDAILYFEISANMRFITFASPDEDLVENDTNKVSDVFVYDRETSKMSRVSVASDGTEGNKMSISPSISADGRYVVFVSDASNLVDNDIDKSPNSNDVYLHDRETGETILITIPIDNQPTWGSYSSISADGRYIAFTSNFPFGGVFVHDHIEKTTVMVSVNDKGNRSDSWIGSPRISANGKYVVFLSSATNLVPGVPHDDNMYHVYVAPSDAPPLLMPDTIGVFNPTQGTFALRYTNSSGPADLTFRFGDASDLPIAGDWNGDGLHTVGIYSPSTGMFTLKAANSASAPVLHQFKLGFPGDLPVVGDWNGDGKDSIGLFRPSTGTFYLKNSFEAGFADYEITFGQAGDQPVAGDWDGDGIDTVGVYRINAFILTNLTCTDCAPLPSKHILFGMEGDIPLVGNWQAINAADGIGIFRPSTGQLYLQVFDDQSRLLNKAPYLEQIDYGRAGELPIAGKWRHLPYPLIEIVPTPALAPTFVPRP